MTPSCAPAISWRWCQAAFTPKPRSGWPSDCCCRRRPRWAPTPTRSGPGQRAGRRSPTGCWSWPAAPRAGSDHQLAFVNALCTSVLSDQHMSVLTDLLDTRPRRRGPGRADGRHRSALADRHRAGRRRRGRRRRSGDAVHRCGGAARPDCGGQAARRAASAARPQSAVKEAAWSQVIEDDTLANIVGRVDHRRFRSARTGRAAEAVRRAVLRRDPRTLGAAVQRGRADRGGRPVPVVGHQR